MLTPTVYGYADQDEVERAIAKRAAMVDTTRASKVTPFLSEALTCIAEINQSIPTHSKYRHLVASALERFANGSSD